MTMFLKAQDAKRIPLFFYQSTRHCNKDTKYCYRNCLFYGSFGYDNRCLEKDVAPYIVTEKENLVGPYGEWTDKKFSDTLIPK